MKKILRMFGEREPHKAYAEDMKVVCHLLDTHCSSEGSTLFEKMITARSLDPRVRLLLEKACLWAGTGVCINLQAELLRVCRRHLSLSLKKTESPTVTILRFVLMSLSVLCLNLAFTTTSELGLVDVALAVFMGGLGIAAVVTPRRWKPSCSEKVESSPMVSDENSPVEPMDDRFCGGIPYYQAVALGTLGIGALRLLGPIEQLDPASPEFIPPSGDLTQNSL